MLQKLKYINLFSGIGGWEQGLADLPMENVLSCEIDKYARQTFLANFPGLPCVKNGYYPDDVRTLDLTQIPDFDILIASFPCQSFSMIGKRLGLKDKKDDKGEMIFEVLRILKARRPPKESALLCARQKSWPTLILMRENFNGK